jgi:predicted O-linked N-acetylglucosamine transferase (SPINDLY family)
MGLVSGVVADENDPVTTNILRLYEFVLHELGKVLGERIHRVIVLPRQPLESILNLLRLADAVLDPIHWCGGVTALEAFAVGSPLVTLPGRFLRGRIAYACYCRMGIRDCVAADADDYVRLAVRLGKDSAWRASLRTRILAANHVLFENAGAVRELEQFFSTSRQQASVNPS